MAEQILIPAEEHSTGSILYILMGAAFCVLLIIYKPQFTWPGLIIVLIGIPLYYLAISQRKKQS